MSKKKNNKITATKPDLNKLSAEEIYPSKGIPGGKSKDAKKAKRLKKALKKKKTKNEPKRITRLRKADLRHGELKDRWTTETRAIQLFFNMVVGGVFCGKDGNPKLAELPNEVKRCVYESISDLGSILHNNVLCAGVDVNRAYRKLIDRFSDAFLNNRSHLEKFKFVSCDVDRGFFLVPKPASDKNAGHFDDLPYMWYSGEEVKEYGFKTMDYDTFLEYIESGYPKPSNEDDKSSDSEGLTLDKVRDFISEHTENEVLNVIVDTLDHMKPENADKVFYAMKTYFAEEISDMVDEEIEARRPTIDANPSHDPEDKDIRNICGCAWPLKRGDNYLYRGYIYMPEVMVDLICNLVGQYVSSKKGENSMLDEYPSVFYGENLSTIISDKLTKEFGIEKDPINRAILIEVVHKDNDDEVVVSVCSNGFAKKMQIDRYISSVIAAAITEEITSSDDDDNQGTGIYSQGAMEEMILTALSTLTVESGNAYLQNAVNVDVNSLLSI